MAASTYYQDWSRKLGLATSPLFGGSHEHAHMAMLDGVAGSFILSDDSLPGFDARSILEGPDWSWSSMMRNHVLVQNDKVVVTQAASEKSQTFSLTTVSSRTEEFLAFLERPPINPTTDVVDHVVGAFQGLRAELPATAEQQLADFLALVALAIAHPSAGADELTDLIDTAPAAWAELGLDGGLLGDFAIGKDLASRFYQQLLTDQRSGGHLRIDLTVRHAGAELFQAAQLAPPPPELQTSLWGLNTHKIRVRPHSLKGVAYTPIGLARSLAEQTLALSQTAVDGTLTIMDPACGSGSFLVEAIAALERREAAFKVRVIGYDISPTAVTSAKFAVACAARDAGLDLEFTIEQRDFLEIDKPVPDADVILMNPPYLSWQDMTEVDRKKVREVLGASYKGRPDMSMAFVQRAVDSVGPNALLGILLPVGVVAGDSGKGWRERLLKQAPPRTIAVLGDHSLFRYATVNVAAVILDKGSAGLDARRNYPAETQMLWSSEKTGAASSALRQMRRLIKDPMVIDAAEADDELGERSWSLYTTPVEEIQRRPTWLPAPGLLSVEARRTLTAIDTRVIDLFDVKSGIKSGNRDAFIISEREWLDLPSEEQVAFRPIAESRAISEGQIRASHYLFSAGGDFADEKTLEVTLPTYFETHLRPARTDLLTRVRSGAKWWRLSEARNSWRSSPDPRIVSRQWIRNNGFAVDADGSYAVVTGFAWFAKRDLKNAVKESPRTGTLLDILRAYCVLMSSDVFFRVAREYSTNAGGGQLDMQQKYIAGMPLPLLPAVLQNTPGLLDLYEAWNGAFPELSDRNRFAARCFGFDPDEFQ
jgi:predicted RNA methylase